MTNYCHVLRLLDAVVVELVQFSVDDGPIFSDSPVVPGKKVGLPSVALELRVDISVVVIILVNLGHILCLVYHLTHVVSHNKVSCTAKIYTWFIPMTWKTLRMMTEKLKQYVAITPKLLHIFAKS